MTWTSLNPNITTIDEAGLATAVASGQVTVAAEVGGLAGYAVLTVSVPSASPVVSWSPMISGTTRQLRGVWGTSPTDVYAVGSRGTILHYDGTDWSAMVSPVDLESLNDVWGTSSDDIYAVGQNPHGGDYLPEAANASSNIAIRLSRSYEY